MPWSSARPTASKSPRRARHDLLRLHVLELRELVAILRRALELERCRRLLHSLAEPLGHDVAAAFEEQDGVLEVARVVLGVIRATHGAVQRSIWCCRHGRLRFSK